MRSPTFDMLTFRADTFLTTSQLTTANQAIVCYWIFASWSPRCLHLRVFGVVQLLPLIL
jgi:hypothetical protein